MRDKNDTAPPVGDLAADFEQSVDFGRRQHRRRLIEKQQPRLTHQTFDHLDALALTDRQVVDEAIRVDGEIVGLRQFADPLGEDVALKPATALTHHEVFNHRHGADDAEVLVHHGNSGGEAVGWPGGTKRATVEANFPGVGLMDAEDHVAER